MKATKNQVIIVNDKDEIIGYKGRNDVVKDDIYRVAGLWVENSKGEVLLAQRVFSKKNDPGKWGPAVSGTVEKGETYDSNIIKEAEEEVGMKDCEFRKGEKKRIIGDHNYFVQWYFVKLDKKIEDFKIDKREVAALRWLPVEELEKMIKENSEEIVDGFKKIPS